MADCAIDSTGLKITIRLDIPDQNGKGKEENGEKINVFQTFAHDCAYLVIYFTGVFKKGMKTKYLSM
ncbi:hypothetical protein OXIME_001650 [Oxyplasma meridianum]|uniref:Transposase n=1 Tax=Oxyplasma meridianum TaxID=3073602 RepID=A0AAX4NIX2_9ARCH